MAGQDRIKLTDLVFGTNLEEIIQSIEPTYHLEDTYAVGFKRS